MEFQRKLCENYYDTSYYLYYQTFHYQYNSSLKPRYGRTCSEDQPHTKKQIYQISA